LIEQKICSCDDIDLSNDDDELTPKIQIISEHMYLMSVAELFLFHVTKMKNLTIDFKNVISSK
jgi:hypothetical protein